MKHIVFDFNRNNSKTGYFQISSEVQITSRLLFAVFIGWLVTFKVCLVSAQCSISMLKKRRWQELKNSILAPFDDKAGKLTSAEHNPRAHEAKIRNFFHPSLRGLTDKPTFIFIYFILNVVVVFLKVLLVVGS